MYSVDRQQTDRALQYKSQAGNHNGNSQTWGDGTIISRKHPHPDSGAQALGTRKVQKQNPVSLQTTPALNAEKTREVVPLTPGDFADTILSELHRLLSEEEQNKLDQVASNSGYREKLVSFLSGGFKSRQYYQTDTCNTLYWGLINQQLTPEEFLHHHTKLLIMIFFFPRHCKGVKPLYDAINLATDIKSIALNDIKLCDYSQKNQNEISAFTEAYPDSQEIFEIKLSHRAQVKLLKLEPELELELGSESGSESESESESELNSEDAYIEKLQWLLLLDSTTPGVWLTAKKDKVILGSFSLLQNAVKPKNEAGEEITIKPTFGETDWKGLKEMRLQEQHPIAIWHPEIDSSMERPDGLYISSLAVLHDFLHVNILNTADKAKRQKFLQLDTEVVSPRIDFYERLMSGAKTPEDEQFIKGFNTIFSEIYGHQPEDWQHNIKQYYDSDEDIKDRHFVDQVRLDEENDNYDDYISCWSTDLPDESLIQFHEILAHHLLIFQIASSDNHELAKKILGIEIKEYPEVVSGTAWDGNGEMKGKYGLADREIEMSQWVAYLRQNTVA